MTPAIKICGLTTTDSLHTCINLGIPYFGMVFYPPSPRHIDVATASHLSQEARGHILSVGVFVNPTDKELDAILEHAALNYIQLHGDETPERCVELKKRYSCKIIKSLAVQTHADLSTALQYDDHVDIILLDAKPPKTENALPGGNGLAFDWRLAQKFHPSCHWALSGGLNPDNVAEALNLIKPDIIDVSSGVESAPGVKDPEKIKAFIQAAS